MTTIPNVKPFENQLAAPAPSDGQPDENKGWNCGEDDVSWILDCFFGIVIPPDDIKDFLLGQDTANAPSQMDAYRSFFGARHLPVAIADLAPSVDVVKAEIDKGHPVVLLIPSLWNAEPPPTTGNMHFVVAYAYDAINLHCMNPWGGFEHIGTFAYWQARLRGGAVWSFSKTGDLVSFDATKYTKQADGSYRHANGVIVGSGDYAFLRDNGINTPPMYGEIPRGAGSAETYLPLGDAGSELGYVYWDGKAAHLNYWGGHGMVSLEQARKTAVAQLADMKAQRDALSAKLADLQSAYETATQASAAKDGQIAQLQAQVAQLQAQLAAGDPQSQDAKAALEGLRAYFAKYPAPAA